MSKPKFKKGDQVVLTIPAHGMNVGEVGIIESGESTIHGNDYRINFDGDRCHLAEKFLKLRTTDKETFKKELQKLKESAEQIQAKLDWMENVGVEEYDEDEYKVWETLTILEDGFKTKKTKTKMIAKLLKK